MSENKPYDLLLRGGHVICPASEINGVMDVAVRDGKIAAVQKDILPASAKEVVDVRGRLVLPGMIDTHAHVYRYVSGRFGMDADLAEVMAKCRLHLATDRAVQWLARAVVSAHPGREPYPDCAGAALR